MTRSINPDPPRRLPTFYPQTNQDAPLLFGQIDEKNLFKEAVAVQKRSNPKQNFTKNIDI
jgi:hypothetical protein